MVLCGVFFALLATAVRERALKIHEHHMVFTVYGACRLFARRAKTTRNNEEKRGTNQPENTSKNEGRNGPEQHQKIGPKSSPNGSEIALARVLAPLGAHVGLLGAVLASLGGLLALLAPLGRLLERSCTEGCRLERLSRGRAQRIASSRAKWNENGLKMLPRGLPNRSKIAPRWLPGGSRAPPESAHGSGDLSCSFFWPLGRLSGRSWVALGRSWRSLGASWAVPGPPGALLGAIFVTQGPPLGPVWVSFSDVFGKTRKP